MTVKRRASLGTALALAAVFAPMAQGDDFATALAHAYSWNPNLQVARSQVSAADESVAMALAARRPVVSGFISAGKAVYKEWPYSTTASPEALQTYRYDQTSAGVFVNQSLYAGGALDAQLTGAEAQVQGGRASLQGAEQQILLAAASAYLDLWLAEDQLAIYRDNEGALRREVEFNQRQLGRQEITVTDLGQSETRLAQAVSDRVLAENTLADAKIAYRVVIGLEPGKRAGLPEVQRLPGNLEEALSRTAKQYPDIAAALHGERSAQASVEVQRAAGRPSVSLAYQRLSSRNPSTDTPRLDQESLLVNLNLPIYLGGSVDAQVRSARQQLIKAGSAVEEARRNAIQATVNAWHLVKASQDSVVSYREQVRAAKIALEGVKLEAEQGSRTILDVLNARRELKTARLSLKQAEHDDILSQLQLLAATGELNAAALELPVEQYDPTTHYEQARSRWSDWGQER